MPVAPSYPGVYLEEIPSGSRTITGAATSIAAFVGWASKGPTDRAEPVLSWPDFERKFGGLDDRSLLGHSVSHFFANGGQRAYVVRLVTAGSTTLTDNAAPAAVTLDGKLTLTAKSPGAWGNDYAIVIKTRDDDKSRFQLKVVNIRQDARGVPVEDFDNLSMKADDARCVANVLKAESLLVSALVLGAPAATDPPASTAIPTSPPHAGEVPSAACLQHGNDGKPLDPQSDAAAFVAAGRLSATGGTDGIFLLDHVDLFNLLCVPGLVDATALANLQTFCRDRRAFLIADCARGDTPTSLRNGPNAGMTGDNAINAAFYFPWVSAPDPLKQGRPEEFPPCGFVAGLYARTDTSRGVWKAPAGTEASLTGVLGLKNKVTNEESGLLNPRAVNCIRTLPVYGTVVWGARTLQGGDERGSEWKYIPVRRTALFIEESLLRALKWVVFEANDEPLWSQIRLNVGSFMHQLFRQGAFQGKTPSEAYFVKCDRQTMTQSDIDQGIVNIVVGFAPLKPAEFVIIKIQQMAARTQT